LIMKRTIALVAASAMALSPAMAMAKPTSGSISPAHDTGQPGVECEDGGIAPGTQSGRDPGPGSPFQEDSVSGSHYAGEQAGINDKNTASVSQYDIACFRGPDRPDGE
jgi:hypothetical protein